MEGYCKTTPPGSNKLFLLCKELRILQIRKALRRSVSDWTSYKKHRMISLMKYINHIRLIKVEFL